MLTCATGLTRRVPLINLDQGSSVPPGFVFKLADELTPSHITDRLGKLGIFDHVLDSQALHAHHLVFVDDACAELVLVVPSAIGDTSMETSNFQTGLVPVLGALLFARMPPLSFCQLLLIFGKIARVANALTSRESHHRLDAKIKTNHFVDNWLWFNVLFYQDRDKVAVCTILGDGDRTGFGPFGQRSMPVDIQRVIHLRKRERHPIPFEGVSGIGSRLVLLFFLESGIVSSSFKEVHKGTLQMSQRLLKRNRRNLREPRRAFLEIRQHGSKIVIVEALSMLKIGRLADMQSPIVNKADTSKRLSKDDPLLISGIEPEFVCPLRFLAHGLFAFLLLLDVLFNGGQNFTVERPIVLFSYLAYLFQQTGRKPDRERSNIVLHATIIVSILLHIKWLVPTSQAPNKERALYPYC
jgi:hypothetical protein